MPGENNALSKLLETVDIKIKELARRIRRLEDTARQTFTAGHVLYAGTDELPTSESAFSYNASTNTLTVTAITAENWIAPGSLLNSWANWGSGFNAAGYYKDPFGRVHLRGLMKNGTVATGSTGVIFTLPSGYRPANVEIYPVVSNSVLGECRIEQDGDVVAYAGSNVWFCLDGISFRAV